MEKGIVIGIFCILMLMSTPIAISSESYSNQEITISKSIITASADNELDIIFSELREKMENVNTKEECNTLFKETIIKLDKCGLLGGISVDNAYKLVSSSVVSDNTYSITGETSNTAFLEHIGVYWYEYQKNNPYNFFMEYIADLIWRMFFSSIKLPYHTGSWITFGYGLGNWEGRIDEYVPANGYINVVGPDGEEEYNGGIFGHKNILGPFGWGTDNLKYHYVGIKGFKGWNQGDYYFGTAEVIDIGYSP
jgi:hypothetical protein